LGGSKVGRQRRRFALRLPALLPFDAHPDATGGAEQESDSAGGDHRQRRIGDQLRFQRRVDDHGHTAVPGQPAAMYAGSSKSKMRRG